MFGRNHTVSTQPDQNNHCRTASTAAMGSENKGENSKGQFDVRAASELVEGLRGAFGASRTRSYQWRESQLKALLKMTEENEQEIADALRADLSKPELESFIYEVGPPLVRFLVCCLSLMLWESS